MATSGPSLDQRREKKPESVQFWLAIVAVSLLFHALLIVGVKRLATVAVVEPAGGPIDVELMEPADSRAVAVDEPIVPAIASKPEPVRPEPTPLPEFTPEPSPEVIQKPEPIVKPEEKQEKKPIVKPENKQEKPSKVTKETPPGKPKSNTGEAPITSNDSLKKPPLPTGSGIKSVNFGVSSTIDLTAQSKAELGGTATLTMPKFPPILVAPNFPLRPKETLTVTLSFSVNNLTGEADSPTLSKIPNLDDKDQEQIQIAIVDSFSKVKFSPPKINIKGGAPPPDSTEWTITLQLMGV